MIVRDRDISELSWPEGAPQDRALRCNNVHGLPTRCATTRSQSLKIPTALVLAGCLLFDLPIDFVRYDGISAVEG